jgi:peroxiredoxin Q/BCP
MLMLSGDTVVPPAGEALEGSMGFWRCGARGMLRVLMMGWMFWTAGVQAASVAPGEAAPDFELLDQNGRVQQLADYRGQWIVLYFYPKNDTPGCTTEACAFRDGYLEIKALRAEVLGVSLDDTESHAAFAAKYALPFPLLADLQGEVASRYGVLWKLGPLKFAKRQTFIIDPQGRIAKHYASVDPDQHVQQVTTDLRSLMTSAAPR